MLAPRFSRVNRQHSCSRLLPLTRSNTGDPVGPVVRMSDSCTLPFRSSSPSFRPFFHCFSKMTSSAATVSPPQLNGAVNSPPLAESGSTEEILRARLRELRVQVTQKAEQVRTLKQANARSDEIGSCTEALAKLRLQLSELEKQVEGTRPLYYQLKSQCENLLKRRFFVVPAFEIYGGVGGLYDFGPPGCALKAAVEQLWRQHFVLAEDMLEVSGPCLTPHIVLKTSGHVDRFTDLMVKDVVTNDCLRADKYLEEKIDERLNAKEGISVEEETRLQLLRRQADALSVEEMKQAFVDLKIKSPADNDLSDPFPFNLMFGLKIGPKDEQAENAVSGAARVNNNSVKGNTNDPVASSSSSSSLPAGEAAASPSSLVRNKPAEGQGYLRPETAQGIFVNFRRLLEFNGGRMPFAAAQLGLGFRNEIAPRNGLLRVREFQMGEIEHFVHPDEKQHAKFPTVAHLKLPLFSRERQLTDGHVSRELTLQEAVARKVVDNETLGYFLARTYLFLRKCGIAETGLRFRQHLPSEMAHYAKDCWDAEVECSYGWVEVAGHADRAAYDLCSHSKASKVDLVAFRKYDEPRTVEYVKYTPNKGLCGKTFRDRQQALHSAVEERSDADKLDIEKQLATEGKYVLTLCTGERFEITREMMKFEKATKKVSEEAYTPAVIEPSFGIGRVLHCIMEHSFRSRGIVDQEERCYMAFPAVIAPTKCVILPISSNAQFTALLQKARNSCLAKGLSTKVDASTASIGKRYARNDEVGTPFAITVDFRSLEDDTVTLRERDSMHQIRATLEVIVDLMAAMCADQMSWAQVVEKHPLVTVKEDV